MDDSQLIFTRRVFLATAGIGTAGAALPARPRAAELTPAEEANLKVVNDFCAGWKTPVDWDRLSSFLAADARFRGTQDSPVNEGRVRGRRLVGPRPRGRQRPSRSIPVS